MQGNEHRLTDNHAVLIKFYLTDQATIKPLGFKSQEYFAKAFLVIRSEIYAFHVQKGVSMIRTDI